MRQHFDRAIELSKGKRAGTYVSYAENACLPAQNAAEFKTMLEKALAIDPFGGKDLQLLLGGLAADGSINYLQIGHHRLGVFPTHEAQTSPYHMHDAQLYGRLRIGRLDRKSPR